MDFELTVEQSVLRDEVIRFARGELNHDVGAREAQSRFPAPEWEKCARFGLQGLPVPQEHGGQGADPLTVMSSWRRSATGAATTA